MREWSREFTRTVLSYVAPAGKGDGKPCWRRGVAGGGQARAECPRLILPGLPRAAESRGGAVATRRCPARLSCYCLLLSVVPLLLLVGLRQGACQR